MPMAATKNILAITLLLISLGLYACSPEPSLYNIGESPDLSTNTGLIEYLRKQPAVKEAKSWAFQQYKGLEISTQHYNIYTTLVDPLVIARLASYMESAYRAYQNQLPAPVDTRYKFIVYLFADRGQWEAFTKSFTPQRAHQYMKIRKGAYYLNGACVAYHIGITRTFSALAHEGWHQFNSRHFAHRLPSWLDEGIATLFESGAPSNGGYIFEPEKNLQRLGALKKTVQEDNLISLSRLLVLNPGQVVANSSDVMAYYSQCYALVRFLRENEYGKRLLSYQSLLLDGLNGDWPIESDLKKIASDRNIPLTVEFNEYVSQKLFAHYFGDDIDNIQAQYEKFCRQLVYHVRIKKAKL